MHVSDIGISYDLISKNLLLHQKFIQTEYLVNI